MFFVQSAALVLAMTVAFLINRPKKSAGRSVIGFVAGLAVGFFVVATLALTIFLGDGASPEQLTRILSHSFLYALGGAAGGTSLGRSSAS